MLSVLYLRYCTNDPDSHSSIFQSTRTLKQLPPVHSFPNVPLFLHRRCRPCIPVSSCCLLRLCQCGPACFLQSAGAATSIIFVATKVMSRETRVCRCKHVFVATDMCLSRQNTSLVRQNYIWRDKHVFVLSRHK